MRESEKCRERKRRGARWEDRKWGKRPEGGGGKGTERQTDGILQEQEMGDVWADPERRAGDREGRMGVETQETDREKRHMKIDPDGENQ